MIKLAYNIDFEVVAFLLTIILYIEILNNYPVRNGKNKEFRTLTLIVIITEAFDLLSAVTNAYSASLPRVINVLVNSGYFMSGLYLCYFFIRYIETVVVGKKEKSRFLKANRVILIVIELAVLINGFFGYFFYFSPEGAYIRGPLYLVIHTISIWFVLCASFMLCINRKRIDQKRMTSSILFISIYFVAVVLQTFAFPHTLIIMPAVSAMLVIAIFSLESPDYLKLQETLTELTDIKRQLEEANEKYYNLAYSDLMTGLKNRTAYNILLEKLKMKPDKEKIIFLIADVNGLKKLNDELGHLVGDDAIVKTGKLLKNHFTDGCQCYRIGGDEFAVIGYDITTELFEESYRAFLADANEESAKSEYRFSVATGYQVTGSLSLLEAIKRADEKMYANKISIKKQLE